MKLTWKKDNKSKKRPLAALSKYPNLPFDQQDQEDAHQNNKDDDNSDNKQDKPLDSEPNKQLAESFQAQGNRLAEVVLFFSIYLPLSYVVKCFVLKKSKIWSR